MGIGTHQDDLEILAYHGIIQAFGNPNSWFTGITVTNGSGSPRDGLYANCTDEQMQNVRRDEQKKAAIVGEYSAVALLDYSSAAVKDPAGTGPVQDIKNILAIAKPEVVYTHNLADKHDTHVAVALRFIQAARELPSDSRPKLVYGCEVWRDLDWACDNDKVALRTDAHENLAAALIGIYDSQIAGGKRYDLATMGRRRATATYHASHSTDECSGLTYALDLTPLVNRPELDPADYITGLIQKFNQDVSTRVGKFMGH